MAVSKFNILSYLSGMTTFVFDKAVLERVAIQCGVAEIDSFADLTEEVEDKCKAMLLETIVYGPYQTASTTNQHGAYTQTLGAQTITSAALESIKAELRRLYNKYGEEDKLNALDATNGEMTWINENDC